MEYEKAGDIISSIDAAHHEPHKISAAYFTIIVIYAALIFNLFLNSYIFNFGFNRDA